MEKARNWKQKSKKNGKNRPRKLENRGLEGVWEVLGATFGKKGTWRLSWQILADFGQAREAQNGSKMGELGGKMGPRWSQDGPRQGLAGHLEASWGAILGISSLQKWLTCKNEHHYGVLATFSSLGVSGWAILGHLSEKLGYLGRS